MRFANVLRAYRNVRKTENELNRLSNRELDDLGISRSEIRTIARHSAR